MPLAAIVLDRIAAEPESSQDPHCQVPVESGATLDAIAPVRAVLKRFENHKALAYGLDLVLCVVAFSHHRLATEGTENKVKSKKSKGKIISNLRSEIS